MEDPVEFSKHNKNTLRDAKEFLAKYQKYFRWFDEPENMLEVGCADGSVTNEVVYPFVEEHLKELTGSDISQKAVDVANQLYKKPKLKFTPIDISENQLWRKYENRFGHIISFYTFHLVGHPERWSENLFKMLKPQGQFFAAISLLPHPFPSATKAQREDKTSPWVKYLEKCPDLFTDYGDNPVETIKSIFENAGFVIDFAEKNRLKAIYPTFENLAASVVAINNFQKCIPEELRPAYIEDFLKKIKENVLENDGSYYFNKTVLIILVTKP